MDTLELLTIKAKMNGMDTYEEFDIAFTDGHFVLKFAKFAATKVGQRWLESDKSKMFREWQDTY